LTQPAPHLELRNGETIRAYLDEVARLKTPVQLWRAGTSETPFETTLQGATAITFSTATTPLMEANQAFVLAFMLDARRFLAQVKVISPGVFRIPIAVTQGERRTEFRGPFERSEAAQVMAVETCAETLLGGRVLQGKLLDLSLNGLRVALDQVGALSGRGEELKAGDGFGAICITALPFTPIIHCRGRVAHIARGGAEPHVGFRLEGLSAGDQKNIERILSPRYPATFGEAFPSKKRKTDLADRLGAPTPTQVKVKAPEIIDRAAPAAQAAPDKPASTAIVRLRKAGKKILVLSEHSGTPALAEAFRQDGFKQVTEAKSFLEARDAARQQRFDLLLMDVRVGGHWAGDMMESLHGQDLLVDTPVVLLADYRNDGAKAMAAALHAVALHERRQGYEDLVPVVYRLLLE
jgi:CheY-like chemotaxis protein